MAGLVLLGMGLLLALDPLLHRGGWAPPGLILIHDRAWLPLRALGYATWPLSLAFLWGAGLSSGVLLLAWVVGIHPLQTLHLLLIRASLPRALGPGRGFLGKGEQEEGRGEARSPVLATLEESLHLLEERALREGRPLDLRPWGEGVSRRRLGGEDPAKASETSLLLSLAALDRAALVRGGGWDPATLELALASLTPKGKEKRLPLSFLLDRVEGRVTPLRECDGAVAILALLHLSAATGREDLRQAALTPVHQALHIAVEAIHLLTREGAGLPARRESLAPRLLSLLPQGGPLPLALLLPRALERCRSAGDGGGEEHLRRGLARLLGVGKEERLALIRRGAALLPSRAKDVERFLETVTAGSGGDPLLLQAMGDPVFFPEAGLPPQSSPPPPSLADLASRVGRFSGWDRFRVAAVSGMLIGITAVSALAGGVRMMWPNQRFTVENPVPDDRIADSHRRQGAPPLTDLARVGRRGPWAMASPSGAVRYHPHLRHFATDTFRSTGGSLPEDFLARLRTVGEAVFAITRHGGLARWDGLNPWERWRGARAFPGWTAEGTRVGQWDGEGTLWLAAEGAGIGRYDPRTRTFLSVWGPEVDPSLGSPRALTPASSGGMWAATGRRLLHLLPGRASPLTLTGDGLPGEIGTVASSSSQGYYLATNPSRLGTVEGSRMVTRAGGSAASFGGPDDLRGASLLGSMLYLVSRDGAVHQYDSESHTFLTSRSFLTATGGRVAAGALTALAADGEGRRLFLGGSGAFLVMEGGDLKWLGSEAGVATLPQGAAVRMISLGAFATPVEKMAWVEGRLWVEAGPVLASWAPGEATATFALDGAPATTPDFGAAPLGEGQVRGVDVDGSTLVMALDTGILARYDLTRRRFTSEKPRGLPSGDPRAVAASPGGVTWMAWPGGVARIAQGGARYLPVAAEPLGTLPSPRTVRAGKEAAFSLTEGGGLLRYRTSPLGLEPLVGERFSGTPSPWTGGAMAAGKLWLTTLGSGVLTYDPLFRRFEGWHRQERGGVPEDDLLTAWGDGHRAWFLSKNGGVAMTQGGAPKVILPAWGQGPEPGEVTAIAGDRQQAWFATRNRIHRYDARTHTWSLPVAGPSADPVRLLPAGSSLAIRTRNQDLWLDGNRVAEGVLEEATDGEGLWIRTAAGLSVLPRGASTPTPALSAAPVAGISSAELVDVAREGDSLWLATAQALLRYDTARRAFDRLPSPPFTDLTRLAAASGRACVLSTRGGLACHSGSWEMVESSGVGSLAASGGRIVYTDSQGALREVGDGGRGRGGSGLPAGIGTLKTVLSGGTLLLLVGEDGLAAYDRERRRFVWSLPWPEGMRVRDATLGTSLLVLTGEGDLWDFPAPGAVTMALGTPVRRFRGQDSRAPFDLRTVRHALPLPGGSTLLAAGQRGALYHPDAHAFQEIPLSSSVAGAVLWNQSPLLALTSGQVLRLSPEGSRPLLLATLPGITSLATDGDGVLLGDARGGVHRLDGQGHLGPPPPPLAAALAGFPPGPVRVLRGGGATFLASSQEVVRVDSGGGTARFPLLGVRLERLGLGRVPGGKSAPCLFLEGGGARVWEEQRGDFSPLRQDVEEPLVESGDFSLVRASGRTAARLRQGSGEGLSEGGRRFAFDSWVGLRLDAGTLRLVTEAGPRELTLPSRGALGPLRPSPEGKALSVYRVLLEDGFWRWERTASGVQLSLHTPPRTLSPLPLPARLESGFVFPFDRHRQLLAHGNSLWALTDSGLLLYTSQPHRDPPVALSLREGPPLSLLLRALSGGGTGPFASTSQGLVSLTSVQAARTEGSSRAETLLRDSLWIWERDRGRVRARFTSLPKMPVWDPLADGLAFSMDRPSSLTIAGGLVRTLTPAGEVAVQPEGLRLPLSSLRLSPPPASPSVSSPLSPSLPWRIAASSRGQGVEIRLASGLWVSAPLRGGRFTFDIASSGVGDGSSLWLATDAGVVRYPAAASLSLADARFYQPGGRSDPPLLEIRSGRVRAFFPAGGSERSPIPGQAFVYDASSDQFKPEGEALPPQGGSVLKEGPVQIFAAAPGAPGQPGGIRAIAERRGGGPVLLDLDGGAFPFDRLLDAFPDEDSLWLATDAGVAHHLSSEGPLPLSSLVLYATPQRIRRLARLGPADGLPPGLYAAGDGGAVLRFDPGKDRFLPVTEAEKARALVRLAPGVEMAVAGRIRGMRLPEGRLRFQFLSQDQGWVDADFSAGRWVWDRFRSVALTGNQAWLSTPQGVFRSPDSLDLTAATLWARNGELDDLLPSRQGPAGVFARSRNDAGRSIFFPASGTRVGEGTGEDPFDKVLLTTSGKLRFSRKDLRIPNALGGSTSVGERLVCEMEAADGTFSSCDPAGGRFPFDDLRDLLVVNGTVMVGTRAGILTWPEGLQFPLQNAQLWPLPGGVSRLLRTGIGPQDLLVRAAEGDSAGLAFRFDTGADGGLRFIPLGPADRQWLPAGTLSGFTLQQGFEGVRVVDGGGRPRAIAAGRFADDRVWDVASSSLGHDPWILTTGEVARGNSRFPAPPGAREVVEAKGHLWFLLEGGAVSTLALVKGRPSGSPHPVPLPEGARGVALAPLPEGGISLAIDGQDGPAWWIPGADGFQRTPRDPSFPVRSSQADGIWSIGPSGLTRSPPARR